MFALWAADPAALRAAALRAELAAAGVHRVQLNPDDADVAPAASLATSLRRGTRDGRGRGRSRTARGFAGRRQSRGHACPGPGPPASGGDTGETGGIGRGAGVEPRRVTESTAHRGPPSAAREPARPDGRERPPPAAAVPLDLVDEWGRDSFPASDPPANW